MSRRRLTTREKRLLAGGLAVVLAALLTDRVLYRLWLPRTTAETAHYLIRTTATRERALEIGVALEVLHATYGNALAGILPRRESPAKFQVKLFKDKKEYLRVNRHKVARWAEAYYDGTSIHAYYAQHEINRASFFLHEAVHQLNAEWGGFPLRRWLSEGLACYYSSSRITREGTLDPRLIDLETYPAYWIYIMAKTGDVAQDVANASIIPLAAILADGGPDIDEHFNLYYLHWWTIVYFLNHYEGGKYAAGVPDLIREGGTLQGFERQIGPVEQVQSEWYAFVIELKKGITAGTIP